MISTGATPELLYVSVSAKSLYEIAFLITLTIMGQHTDLSGSGAAQTSAEPALQTSSFQIKG